MMSFSVLAFAISLVAAVPLTTRAPVIINDTIIAQFALTLEHVENAFYSQGLAHFDEKAFESEGHDKFVRGRLVQISEHEQGHVKFLETLIGSDAVGPCEYNFQFPNATRFIELAGVLESVGTAAYSGVARFIKAPDTIGVAAKILATEGRHAGWISSAAEKEQPWNGLFEVPLEPNQVFTLASQFIKGCPGTNNDLGLIAFPFLTLSPESPLGQTVTISFTPSQPDYQGTLYLVFLTGFGGKAVPIKNGKAKAPQGLQGTVFVIVSTSDTHFTDQTTVAGPAIAQYPFSSSVSNASPAGFKA